MNSILGPYYSPWHWRGTDMQYVSALRPAWARIHQFNARSVSEVQEASRNTKIMLRSWDIDDHNGDRKKEIYNDPIGAAHKHADMWRAKLKDLFEQLQREERYFDTSKWYIGLANEPNSNYLPQIVKYTEEWLRISPDIGFPLGVGVSSVGTFPKPSESPNSWKLLKPLENAINNTGSILICHEYWQPEGPSFVWTDEQGRERSDAGNLAWRHHSIPLDVPILIGESGPNGYIFGRHTQKDDGGWQNYMDAETLAHQTREYIEGCDTRVEGVLLYMMDYHSDQWKSFDTHPAHDALLRITADAKPQVSFNDRDNAQSKQRVMYVAARDGLNIRSAPRGEFVEAIPFGEEVAVYETRETNNETWARIGDSRWVAEWYLSLNKPEIPTEPTTDNTVFLPVVDSHDKFAKTMNFIFKWEGGLSVDKDDPGNYVNGKFVGSKYGISAKSHQDEDIVNLTKERAAEIYKEEYWEASGADKMPWPLCMAHMNLAVNGGVGAAKLVLSKSGQDFIKYMGETIKWYTNTRNWNTYYTAWMRRCADLLIESAK